MSETDPSSASVGAPGGGDQQLTSRSRLEQVIGTALPGDDLVYLTPALEKSPLSAGDPGYVEAYLAARLIERLDKHRKILDETSVRIQSVLDSFRQAGDVLEKSLKETIETSVAEELVKNLDTIQTEIQALCRELAMDETRAAVQVRSQAIADQVAELRRAMENAERARAAVATPDPGGNVAPAPLRAVKPGPEMFVRQALPWIFGVLIGVLIAAVVLRPGTRIRPLNGSLNESWPAHQRSASRSAISTQIRPYTPPRQGARTTFTAA